MTAPVARRTPALVRSRGGGSYPTIGAVLPQRGSAARSRLLQQRGSSAARDRLSGIAVISSAERRWPLWAWRLPAQRIVLAVRAALLTAHRGSWRRGELRPALEICGTPDRSRGNGLRVPAFTRKRGAWRGSYGDGRTVVGVRRGSGDEQGARVRGQETSRGIKAGPQIRRAASRRAYTPPSESRCFSPAVAAADWSTSRRCVRLATCRRRRSRSGSAASMLARCGRDAYNTFEEAGSGRARSM